MPRKVYFDQFGGPEVLVVRDEPAPEAGPGEVRVRVHAAGLNPSDWKKFTGGPGIEVYNLVPPSGNGNDFSGIVDRVGAGVEGIAVGDEVYGGARFHAQADYLIVTDTSTLNPLPAGLDLLRAATLDIAARSAVAAMRAVPVGSHDTVLVSAAAGGIGIIVSQLAVREGARVLGTASPANHEYLAKLGVEPIAYGPGLIERLRTIAPAGITAVLDNHGRETVEAALALGVPRDRINSVGLPSRVAATEFGVNTAARPDTHTWDVRPVADLVAAGDVVVPIEAAYRLEEVASAYRHLMAGHLRGKIVLDLTRTSRSQEAGSPPPGASPEGSVCPENRRS